MQILLSTRDKSSQLNLPKTNAHDNARIVRMQTLPFGIDLGEFLGTPGH